MKSLEQIEPFTYGYLHSKNKDVEYRIANSIFYYAKNVEIAIDLSDWFVGNAQDKMNSWIRYRSNAGLCRNETDVAFKNIKNNPQQTLGLLSYMAIMFPHVTGDIVFRRNGLKTFLLGINKNLWGAGTGHANPDYKMLLELGTNGIRGKIEKYRKINSGKDTFYDSLKLCLDGFDILAQRYQQKAKDMYASATDEDKVKLKRIIDAFDNIPQNEPRNFFEACQFFWLAFSFLEIDSPGLFDYALGKYYIMDTSGNRYECLQSLWELFHKTRTWNLCVGGSDENWNDLSNDLTFDILKVAREYKYNTPNITMRFHRNSPERAWNEAVETLATGIGMPAIYNDECVCSALEQLGIPPKDSHLYCLNGCNQIDIFGKSHMGLEDGEICVAKALEYTLFKGVCQFSKMKLGLNLGNPTKFRTFDEFMSAFYKELDYMSDKVTSISNACQKIFAKYAPNPWRSNLIEGCIERGMDFKNHGPLYGHGQILTEGLPDTVDSIIAIKHYIYDTQKYTMQQLVDALKKDYVGYDELYKDFSSYHKFGNDIDDVDELYKDITHHLYKYILTKDTFRGGKYGVGCSTFQRAAEYGGHLGALPNGKKKNDTTLADSIGAVPGCDVNGPTALLNSILKVDQTLAKSGNVMQMKFPKAQFVTPTGKQAFVALAKTYFRKGGQTLQINVVSKEELLDAQIHPEKHQNLIVRVGGFSQYFVRLDKGLQENIIKRTENNL